MTQTHSACPWPFIWHSRPRPQNKLLQESREESNRKLEEILIICLGLLLAVSVERDNRFNRQTQSCGLKQPSNFLLSDCLRSPTMRRRGVINGALPMNGSRDGDQRGQLSRLIRQISFSGISKLAIRVLQQSTPFIERD